MSKRATAFLPIALAILLFGAAAPAAAHTGIESTTPSEGETLTVLPETFSVTASEELNDLTGDGEGFALEIRGEDGTRYDDGTVTIDGRTASTPARLGEPGEYTFAYQVVGEDGHPVAGEVHFTWAPETVDGGQTAAPAPTTEATPPAEEGDGLVTIQEDADAAAPGLAAWVVPTIIVAAIVVIAVVVAIVLGRRRRS